MSHSRYTGTILWRSDGTIVPITWHHLSNVQDLKIQCHENLKYHSLACFISVLSRKSTHNTNTCHESPLSLCFILTSLVKMSIICIFHCMMPDGHNKQQINFSAQAWMHCIHLSQSTWKTVNNNLMFFLTVHHSIDLFQ